MDFFDDSRNHTRILYKKIPFFGRPILRAVLQIILMMVICALIIAVVIGVSELIMLLRK